jgi:hypothetical protein
MKRLPPTASFAAVFLGIAACSNSSPTAPSPTASTTTTAPATPTTPAAPPVTVTQAACSAWSGGQRAAGLPPGRGEVQSQREALYSAGGGVRAVNNRYYAMWFPSNWATSSPKRAMVGLHGTGGAPETEWSIDWKDIVSSKGWAYIGLKYVDDTTGVHDDDGTIYSNLKTMIDDVQRNCDFGSPLMFLVGFSRGSAQTLPIIYRDLKDRRFFMAAGSNSGSWTPGGAMVPTMADIQARGETTAYNGAQFWMYCGALDNVQGYPMCDGMKNARTFITSYGGYVERLYEDPLGGHGGLAKNADAWSSMMT